MSTELEGYLKAFATRSGNVIGVYATGNGDFTIDYVNDEDSVGVTVQLADLDPLADALQEIAEAFRQQETPEAHGPVSERDSRA